MFSGSNVLEVVLPISWDVDVCSKSKMAANNYIRWFYRYTYVLPKPVHQYMVLFFSRYPAMGMHPLLQEFMTMYETSKSPAIMADATSCRKSKMLAN